MADLVSCTMQMLGSWLKFQFHHIKIAMLHSGGKTVPSKQSMQPKPFTEYYYNDICNKPINYIKLLFRVHQ